MINEESDGKCQHACLCFVQRNQTLKDRLQPSYFGVSNSIALSVHQRSRPRVIAGEVRWMDPTQLRSAVETTNQWWHIKSAGERAAARWGQRDRRGFSAAVTDDPVFGDTAQLERL